MTIFIVIIYHSASYQKFEYDIKNFKLFVWLLFLCFIIQIKKIVKILFIYIIYLNLIEWNNWKYIISSNTLSNFEKFPSKFKFCFSENSVFKAFENLMNIYTFKKFYIFKLWRSFENMHSRIINILKFNIPHIYSKIKKICIKNQIIIYKIYNLQKKIDYSFFLIMIKNQFELVLISYNYIKLQIIIKKKKIKIILFV